MAKIVGLNKSYVLDDLYGKFISTSTGNVYANASIIPPYEIKQVIFIPHRGMDMIEFEDRYELTYDENFTFSVPKP